MSWQQNVFLVTLTRLLKLPNFIEPLSSISWWCFQNTSGSVCVSLSLNGWMVIWQQNSYQITIWIKSVKQPNGNQLFDWLFPQWPNGNLATVLSRNCHSAIQTQTQTQTKHEAYRMHLMMYTVTSSTNLPVLTITR